jgi:hypothetical protein
MSYFTKEKHVRENYRTIEDIFYSIAATFARYETDGLKQASAKSAWVVGVEVHVRCLSSE